MSVLFACPHCQAETVVDDAYVGQSGPCATCGRMVTVPDTGQPRRTVVQRAAKAGLGVNLLGILIGVILGSLGVAALVIGVSVSIIAPAVTAARATSLKSESAQRLQAIAQAMQQYHADYGSFPPAYVADAKGKPMHSWRVLLLPYLGKRDVYQRYDFNQPWDSATNMQLLGLMPEEYGSPGDVSTSTFDTSYLVIVGRRTIFPGTKSLNMNDVKDGLATTLLVVESTESGICWLEPKDLDAGQMDYGINSGNKNGIRSHHPYGAQAVFADGTTHYLTNDLPPEFVEALSTAANNDEASLDALGEE